MAQGYRVKGVDALKLVDGYMQEVELEGLHDSKVLLIKSDGKLRATGSKCTHYGAPLKNGVLTADGRLTCPWHGACFNVKSGDVEDAPALDPIASFDVVEQNGAVYVTGDESTIKSGRKTLDGTCSIRNKDRILVVGGGSATIGVMEELRRCGFEGSITVLSMESQPYDRTKLSKALVADRSSLAWRTSEFYQKLSINIQQEEVVSVDFAAQLVKIRSGNTFSYTTLILATGGKPRSLPLDGLKEGDFENVFLLRSIEHVDAINAALGDRGSKKVVVIGSSFIGMEVANCLAGQNHEVSVVGMESEPCEAVFGTKLGAVFRSLLEKNGVRFHMAAQVSHASPSMSDPRTVGSVHLKDGQVLPADIVIEGVGVVPATQFLQGSKDGPPLEQDGSILVDENFRIPNLHNVYAIGDIATYPYRGNNVRIEHWNVAQNMGRQVARHISSKAVKNFTPIFWSALGMQLRYCGNISGGYEDVIIQGTTDVTDSTQPSFAAYFYRGNEILAVATMGKDPIMSKSAEAMRRGCMLSRQDIEAGRDILSLKI